MDCFAYGKGISGSVAATAEGTVPYRKLRAAGQLVLNPITLTENCRHRSGSKSEIADISPLETIGRGPECLEWDCSFGLLHGASEKTDCKLR